jgi:hypothetical protein
LAPAPDELGFAISSGTCRQYKGSLAVQITLEERVTFEDCDGEYCRSGTVYVRQEKETVRKEKWRINETA